MLSGFPFATRSIEEAMDIAANKNCVRIFLSRFEKGEINALLDMMSDDATWWINGKPHLFPFAGSKSKVEMRTVFGELFAFFVDGLRMDLKSSIAEGDAVAAEVRSSGVLRNGKQYENEYHILFRLREGMIAEVREYTDPMHAVEVMTA